jgi:hypothetical protein
MATGLPNELAERWHPGAVLKRDLFSTVERGQLSTPEGIVDAVLRRIDQVPWWTRPIASHLLWREKRALEIVGPIRSGARLLLAGRGFLVRSWIDGAALHFAPPIGDAVYFRSAKTLLRKLHRSGVCHNDLAKRQNWLRGRDNRAYVTDFQLASAFRRRNKLFRILAYEDLRHLLKYKRLYAPELMTPSERRMVARKSFVARTWMVTGKQLYMLVTRGILHFADQEGTGPRVVYEATRLTTLFKMHPQVSDVAIVSYHDRIKKVGLHAFVEGLPELTEQALRDLVARSDAPEPPERVQLVEALPRLRSGRIHTEILQLVAQNQFDMIDTLIDNQREREVVARIVAGRHTLSDTATG